MESLPIPKLSCNITCALHSFAELRKAVELAREAESFTSASLGLDLDKMDRQNLMVVKTQPGLVSEHNQFAPSEEASWMCDVEHDRNIRKIMGIFGIFMDE